MKGEFSFRLAKISFELFFKKSVSVFLNTVNYVNDFAFVFHEH